MEHFLAEMGFPFEVVRVHAEGRANLTISDKQGLTIKLNEIGAPLEEKEVAAVRELVEARLKKASWLMICGSTQPGVPPNFYSEIIAAGQEPRRPDAARYRRRGAQSRAGGRALRHFSQSAGSRAPAGARDYHAQPVSRSGEAHPRHGSGSRDSVAGQPGRAGLVLGGNPGGAAAARGGSLSHRRRRCAGGGVCLGHGKEEAVRRRSSLGRRGGNRHRCVARDELPDARSDQRDLQAGGSPPGALSLLLTLLEKRILAISSRVAIKARNITSSETKVAMEPITR